MVYHGRRGWRSREEVPREFRERRSLEWSPGRTSHLLRNSRLCHVSELLAETIGTRVQEDRLWIADPKAINHILQKSGYLYAKPNHVREGSALTSGRGIIWAEGEFPVVTGCSNLANNPTGNVHKRQRRVMAPAFGLVEAKSLLPYFMDSATKACELRCILPLRLTRALVVRWRTSGITSSRTASPGIPSLSM